MPNKNSFQNCRYFFYFLFPPCFFLPFSFSKNAEISARSLLKCMKTYLHDLRDCMNETLSFLAPPGPPAPGLAPDGRDWLNWWVGPLDCFTGGTYGARGPLSRLFDPLNWLLGPLNGLSDPLDWLLGPLNRLLDPLDWLLGPLNRLVDPLDWLLGPLNRLVAPLDHVFGALDWFLCPLFEPMRGGGRGLLKGCFACGGVGGTNPCDLNA